MRRNNNTDQNKFSISEQKSEKSEDIKLDMIAALIGKIDLSEKEMNTQYDDFMKSYPEGKIISKEFKTSFGKKGACSSEFLFKVFDEDKNGFLDFTGFTIASNCIGSFLPEENLCWIDNIRGSVDADVAHKVVVSILKIIGFDEDITEGKVDMVECVKLIFEEVDEDGDIYISKDENTLKVKFINHIC
jgi:hypothetical protein